MDTNFYRADTEQVILIVHEGAEPVGAAQDELLRLFIDAEERRHVERLSALTPAGREILRLAERVKELEVEVGAKEATIHMAVARLGGKVEGHPTHRINFLQRIDALVAMESERRPLTFERIEAALTLRHGRRTRIAKKEK